MTDKEIIKALECCLDTSPSSCGKCPLFNVDVTISKMICSKVAMKISLDLINRQQAEIENLNNFLYDAEGVNLVNYWYQQCEIAENGCRNLEEENKKLKAEIERLQKNSKKVLEICSRVIKANDERNNEIFQGAIEVVRAEAIKEFAERFVNNLPSDNDCNSLIAVGLVKTIIQNVKKEMAGDDK